MHICESPAYPRRRRGASRDVREETGFRRNFYLLAVTSLVLLETTYKCEVRMATAATSVSPRLVPSAHSSGRGSMGEGGDSIAPPPNLTPNLPPTCPKSCAPFQSTIHQKNEASLCPNLSLFFVFNTALVPQVQ